MYVSSTFLAVPGLIGLRLILLARRAIAPFPLRIMRSEKRRATLENQ